MKTKVCYRCRIAKPTTEYGRNRFFLKYGDRDGLAVYCKACRREDVAQRRAKEKQLRALIPKPERKPNVISSLPPIEAVLKAVSEGYRTRELIKLVTDLAEDDVCDALAILWDEGQVRINRERREFHLAA